MRSIPTDSESGAAKELLADPELASALSDADDVVNAGLEAIQFVYRARLAQAQRTAAGLSAQYGSGDARVAAVQSSMSGIDLAAARVAMLGRQLAAPAIQVSKAGWALQGQVVDGRFAPQVGFTVFLVDANKAYLSAYGFSYTDENGFFALSSAGGSDEKSGRALSAFVQVADPSAKPVYLSSVPFVPVIGAAAYQDVVLDPDDAILGNPPQTVRAAALPQQDSRSKTPSKKRR